jgi:multicomponent Na+:H+ antiporter subunit G
MWDQIADMLSWACIVAGGLFGVTGAIGLFRFPEFYTRMHAASITDTLCPGLILLGLMLQATSVWMVLKLILILLILTYTSPTTAHALAKAARQDRFEPVLDDKGEDR